MQKGPCAKGQGLGVNSRQWPVPKMCKDEASFSYVLYYCLCNCLVFPQKIKKREPQNPTPGSCDGTMGRVCVHTGQGEGRIAWYLSWSHFIAMVHRHQVLLTHNIGHMQGNPGHESGTVEQVSVEAVILSQALLVVGAAGPLPLGSHSLQGDAGWEGVRPVGMQCGVRDPPGPFPYEGSPVRRRAARSSSTLARSSRRTCFLSRNCWVRQTLGGGSPMSILSLGSREECCRKQDYISWLSSCPYLVLLLCSSSLCWCPSL